jgi:hypothetical protein
LKRVPRQGRLPAPPNRKCLSVEPPPPGSHRCPPLPP